MLGTQSAIKCGKLEVVCGKRIARKPQIIQSQRHPGNRATCLDRGRRKRIASGLFAGTERAGVASVPTPDAAPVMNECFAVAWLAGDAPQLEQTLQVMQTFPAWARTLKILRATNS